MPPAESTETRALLFRVAGRVYGCALDLVREIIPMRPATRLPGAPPWVHGLINLRGTILTVLDLGARLDPAHDLTRDGSIIVVEVGGRMAGLAVGDVMDVAPIAAQSASTPGADDLVLGMGHLGDTVVILLDVPALIGQVLVSLGGG